MYIVLHLYHITIIDIPLSKLRSVSNFKLVYVDIRYNGIPFSQSRRHVTVAALHYQMNSHTSWLLTNQIYSVLAHIHLHPIAMCNV